MPKQTIDGTMSNTGLAYSATHSNPLETENGWLAGIQTELKRRKRLGRKIIFPVICPKILLRQIGINLFFSKIIFL